MDEKKALYRASFALTYAEILAPTGHWKMILGALLLAISAATWYMVFLNKYCFLPLPPWYTQEAKEQIMQRHIDVFAEPFTGFSSKWDYENNRWKA
ncbi:unnamed protein product [Soboliphyme baturini]|uniref:Cytochrome c oxidase subunit 4 n=1 Tax=Soboliphyme baturini TaxID=241478 RepID=A0A183IC59_9BILA|nr:unnamed protein product [Soboliphyme baturini]